MGRSFFGMRCAENRMSVWWGQNGNGSSVFGGDRFGKILILYDDFTQDSIPLI